MGNTANAYGELQFDDVYEFPGDLNALQAFVNKFAHVRRGTSQQRQDLTPGQLRDGMFFVEYDTGDVYLRRAGGWKHVLGDTGWQALSLATWSSYDPQYVNAQYRRLNGVVHVRGMIKGGAAGSVISTLPVGCRPSLASFQVVTTQAGAGNVELKPDGRILAINTSANWTSLNLSFPADQ